jgi:hypothetical protein
MVNKNHCSLHGNTGSLFKFAHQTYYSAYVLASASTATGSNIRGSLFFGLFTRRLISLTVISSAGYGTRISSPASPDNHALLFWQDYRHPESISPTNRRWNNNSRGVFGNFVHQAPHSYTLRHY